jgi:serine/threonine protein kinase
VSALPATGDVFAHRYELVEEAGSGGFAIAYRAEDRETGETVAVKLPNYDGSSNDREVIDQYFDQEAKTLERIRDAGGHPNLMELIKQGTYEGSPVLVVEFVDGYELDGAIGAAGPLEDSEQVRRIGADLAEAMGFLHENEILYRDLKPDNVMLREDAGGVEPVLIDFNTATDFESGAGSQSSTTILGPYKPPEVAEATLNPASQGPWSDVYSVGKILMFLLKGTVPEKDGVDPRDFGADCEPYLADIVERATRTNHDERYRNATVLAQVLESRDPSRPQQAPVRHVERGTDYTIQPGDTIGRKFASGPSPSIAIEDEEEHISTVQVQFDVDEAGDWLLRDRSLNGTYVETEVGWQRVLSEGGRKRLQDRGKNPTDDHGEFPPETHHLRPGDTFALVHPTYGVTFQFDPL